MACRIGQVMTGFDQGGAWILAILFDVALILAKTVDFVTHAHAHAHQSRSDWLRYACFTVL
jgi:hypothetical protein